MAKELDSEMTEEDMQRIANSGMGIGGGHEYDTEAGISLLAGRWPAETVATPFVVTGIDKFPQWSELLKDDDARERAPGFLLFADPFSACTQVTGILNTLSPGSVVAGGLSCPTSESTPSLRGSGLLRHRPSRRMLNALTNAARPSITEPSMPPSTPRHHRLRRRTERACPGATHLFFNRDLKL